MQQEHQEPNDNHRPTTYRTSLFILTRFLEIPSWTFTSRAERPETCCFRGNFIGITVPPGRFKRSIRITNLQ